VDAAWPSSTRTEAGYELVLTLKDAPGPFAVVEGVAQYDVSNHEDCGRVLWATGTASRITSQEPVELRKVGENEYRGTFYLDRMQDEDYYGRGVPLDADGRRCDVARYDRRGGYAIPDVHRQGSAWTRSP
jgi:hypothetical protein